MQLVILSFGTCIKGLGTKDGKNTKRRTNHMGWNKCGGMEQTKGGTSEEGWNKQGMEQARDETSKGWDNQMMEQAQRDGTSPCRVM
jgi:hypothetical protein